MGRIIHNIVVSKTILITVLCLRGNAVYSQVECINNPLEQRIEILFHLPEYRVTDTVLPIQFGSTETFCRISLSSNIYGIVDSIGFPELPQVTISINLPNNANSISYTITSSKTEYFPLMNRVVPHQIDIPTDGFDSSQPFSQNYDFYNGKNSFLNCLVTIKDSFYIREKKGIDVSFTPFDYNPYTRQLVVTTDAIVNITYSLFPQKGVSSYTQADIWENFYEHFFQNYTISPYKSGSSGRYLMLVPRQYDEKIQPFVIYKQTLGYEVDKCIIEPYEATSSNVMQIIQNKYDNNETRPDFILIIGDYEDIPSYGGDRSAEDEDDPITDVPYAFLQGDDLMVDAFIGRWPIHNDTELQTIINKTIFSEINLHLWEKKAVLIAGDDDNYFMRMAFQNTLDDLASSPFPDNGYFCQRLNQPTENDALTALNGNPVLFIYSGHGSFFSIGPVKSPNFNINNSFIQNSYHELYPMLFVFACKTGNFAAYNNYSIAEHWICNKNGAATYFGSSVSTITNSDNIIERKLLGEAFFEEKYIGAVIASGMQKYRTYFWTTTEHKKRFTKSYNLMGDPSLHVNGWGCSHDYWVNGINLVYGDIQNYRAENTMIFYGTNQIRTGANLALTAGQEIVFQDGFHAFSGAELTASIEPCEPSPSSKHSNIVNLPDAKNSKFDALLERSMPIIRVFPNPTQKEIHVEYVLGQTKIVSFEIFDIYGKVVQCIPAKQKQAGINTEIIEISSLPSGCYFICCVEGGSKYIKCFIKN